MDAAATVVSVAAAFVSAQVFLAAPVQIVYVMPQVAALTLASPRAAITLMFIIVLKEKIINTALDFSNKPN